MFNLNYRAILATSRLGLHTACRTTRVLLSLALIIPVSGALASGVSGGFPASGGAPRQVDEVYEQGKALYLGRVPGSQKIKYCVKVDGALKKIRGRSLRSYRGANQLDFANALYNCSKPDDRALLSIKKEEVAYVLY